MVACLSCEAEIVAVDVEEGETVICEDCGAEHEVVREAPLELALVDDDPEDDDEDDLEAGDEGSGDEDI